jgi:hypothetical protein
LMSLKKKYSSHSVPNLVFSFSYLPFLDSMAPLKRHLKED